MIFSRPTPNRREQRFTKSGFALVITLIMVTLAAVIVVTLLSTATLDRDISKSNTDRYQAELAVRDGLEAVKQKLSTDGNGNQITDDDTFTIVRVPDPAHNTGNEDDKPHYYFIGVLKGGGGNVTYYPLFSGGPPPTAVSATTLPAYSIADPTKVATNLPTLLQDSAVPPSLLPQVTTQWIELHDPHSAATGPYLRYCFWAEDMGGYIDASTAGNLADTDSATGLKIHTRDAAIMQPLIDAGTAMPASLVAIWTLFSPTDPDPAGAPQQANNQGVVSNRGALFTSETVRQVIASPTTPAYVATISRHVVAGTSSDQEQAIIPYGLGYAQEGTPKIDLNVKINAKDVDGIATAIKDHLPTWAASRRGGFGGSAGQAGDDSYRRTIAANIIAYAQPIADPPLIGTDYRSIGPYPLVNEFYDYFNWTGVSANDITVEITSWVELWNMSNQNILGTVRFSDYYRHELDLGVYTYFDDTHDPSNPPNGETVSGIPFPTQQITMQPNEFTVLKFGPATYTLSTGGTIPASPITLHFKTSGRYKLEWQGSGASTFVSIDESGQPFPMGGIQMATNTVYNPGTSSQPSFKWNGTIPGFSYYGGIALYYYNPGDPRSALYNSAPLAANDYSSNATMWSRNAKPTSSVVIGQEVKPSVWADSGHDTTLISPVGLGSQPPATSRPGNAPAIDSTKAPMIVSGAGKLKSIAELGNIYDPAQWKMPTTGDKWTDIDTGSTADQHYGGGFTLRIGRPEFSKFDTGGIRASHLMDIFSVGTRRETQGLINLNTATRETLRALGAGLILNRDPDIQPPAIKDKLLPPFVTNQADKFADAAIAARGIKPFISTSQLAQLPDLAGSPFFGNQSEWTVPQTAPTEWNDPGAEEYFARIVDLASVRSRNFRVFVTGQYVDPRPSGNPKVVSTVKKVFQLFLHPSRAADGSIQSQTIDVTYEHNL